jgi:hypothetical protein
MGHLKKSECGVLWFRLSSIRTYPMSFTTSLTTRSAPSLVAVSESLADLFAPTIFDFPATQTKGHSSDSFTIDIPNAEYHRDRSGVSCSQLKKLVRSAAHFDAALKAPPEDSTGSQNIGTALHTAILEPHLLDDSIVRWEGGTRKGKEWDRFDAANPGKIIFKPAEYASVIGMRDAILNYELPNHPGMTLGEMISKGDAEKTIYWRDDETGIMCKIRVDLMLAPLVTFDLKTVGDSRPDAFLKTQALKLDYDMQAAMYFTGVKAFTGLDLPFCFISVETDFPHGVWLHETAPGMQFFENGMRKFRYALRTLKKCRETGIWPIYEQSYTLLDSIPAYAEFVAPDGME